MNTIVRNTSRRGRMTYNEMRDAICRYRMMCSIRRDRVMKALEGAAFTRNLLFVSVAFNVVLAVVAGALAAGAAK